MIRKLSHAVIGTVTVGALLVSGSTAASAATPVQGPAVVAQVASATAQSPKLSASERSTTVANRTVVKSGDRTEVQQAAAGRQCVNAISIALIGLGTAAVGALLATNPATVFLIGGYYVGRSLLTTFVAAGSLTTAVLSVINAICAQFPDAATAPRHV